MKAWIVLAALGCAACATNDQVAKDEVYHPPVYRTGSNIPSQGSSTSAPDGSGDAMRQAIPPPLVRKPASG